MSHDSFFFENPKTPLRPANPIIKKTDHSVSITDNAIIKTTTEIIPEAELDILSCCQDEVVQVERTVSPYNGICVDSKEDGLLDAIGMMEGSPVKVTYYQQYLGKDDEPYAYSADRLSAFQQYRCIKDFEIRVQSPFSYDFDEEFSISKMTGSAHLYPVMKPNRGDMMLMDIGDGRSGLIEIDTVKRLSNRRNSVWEIEYHVRDFLRESDHQNLQEKTIDTYIFDTQMMYQSLNPFIIEDDYNNLAEIERIVNRLTNLYFNWFFDEETQSFSVPLGNGRRTYDVGHVVFIDKLIDKYQFPKYRNLKLKVIDLERKLNVTTIWDALLDKDWLLIDESSTKFTLLPTSYMRTGNTFQWNAAYSQYQDIIYDYQTESYEDRFTHIPRFTMPAELPIFLQEDTSTNRKYIYSIGINKDYVFSNYFYLEEVDNMSRLERLVYHHLHNKEVCPSELKRLLKACIRWDDLERYYYVPILILLAKGILNGDCCQ